MSSLIDFLKQVNDWRDSSGQKYPLWWVILIVVLGTMIDYLSSD